LGAISIFLGRFSFHIESAGVVHKVFNPPQGFLLHIGDISYRHAAYSNHQPRGVHIYGMIGLAECTGVYDASSEA
jgi:hypothetical protein